MPSYFSPVSFIMKKNKRIQVNNLKVSLNEDSLSVEISSRGLTMRQLRNEMFKTFKKLGVKKNKIIKKNMAISGIYG